MPYDPQWPQDGQLIDAVKFRAQFDGLKTLIDAGGGGPVDAVVDSVSAVNPGDPAVVNVSVIGGVLHFAFEIPRGINGADGSNGTDGSDGAPGQPFATAVVDGVTTLEPGEQATVNASFDGTSVHFEFGIPRGTDGGTGSDGAPGAPGEVTLTDLNGAIDGTSNNTNGVSLLDQSADTVYNQGQMQDVLNKLDELINALRR